MVCFWVLFLISDDERIPEYAGKRSISMSGRKETSGGPLLHRFLELMAGDKWDQETAEQVKSLILKEVKEVLKAFVNGLQSF